MPQKTRTFLSIRDRVELPFLKLTFSPWVYFSIICIGYFKLPLSQGIFRFHWGLEVEYGSFWREGRGRGWEWNKLAFLWNGLGVLHFCNCMRFGRLNTKFRLPFWSANPLRYYDKFSKAKVVMRECSFCRFKSFFERLCLVTYLLPLGPWKDLVSVGSVMIGEGSKIFLSFRFVGRAISPVWVSV